MPCKVSLHVVRSALQNSMCLLCSFYSSGLLSDPTFCGIFVCSPLQFKCQFVRTLTVREIIRKKKRKLFLERSLYFISIIFIFSLKQHQRVHGVAVRRLAQKIMSTRKNGCAREKREGRSLPRASPLLAGFFLHPFLAPVTREARASMALGRKTIVHFTGAGANEDKVDDITLPAFGIQLFRKRLSEKVHTTRTIPKGFLSGFEFTVLQKKLKEWH